MCSCVHSLILFLHSFSSSWWPFWEISLVPVGDHTSPWEISLVVSVVSECGLCLCSSLLSLSYFPRCGLLSLVVFVVLRLWVVAICQGRLCGGCFGGSSVFELRRLGLVDRGSNFLGVVCAAFCAC